MTRAAIQSPAPSSAFFWFIKATQPDSPQSRKIAVSTVCMPFQRYTFGTVIVRSCLTKESAGPGTLTAAGPTEGATFVGLLSAS